MQDKNHLKLDTQNFNRALTFWQALGFEIQKTRGPDGKRVGSLYSDNVEVVSVTSGDHGETLYHLKMKSADKVLKELGERRRDVKLTRHVAGPGWKQGWVRLEDPDGNVYAIEAA